MSGSRVHSFRDLVVWERAFELCLATYRMSQQLPSDERFGLTQELRKTARSVVYNIAEGHRRSRTLEFVRFIDIARGSAAELQTQFLLCQRLSFGDPLTVSTLLQGLDEVERMLASLKRNLLSQRVP